MIIRKITALYERLSREDARSGESDSIAHQKTYLEQTAAARGFENCRHYTDDGWSGGSLLKIRLLMRNGIGISAVCVLAGQAFIQRGDLPAVHPACFPSAPLPFASSACGAPPFPGFGRAASCVFPPRLLPPGSSPAEAPESCR